MNKRSIHFFVCGLALIMATNFTPLKAATYDDSNDLLDPNSLLVNTELYIWNRISDLTDIFRFGIAFGPGIGAEVSVTNYLQFSLYANAEHGLLFPNVVPPFWLADYYDNPNSAFEFHSGGYATAAFGPWRAETGKGLPETEDKHFRRDRWDVRIQLDLLLVHIYFTFRPAELLDFLTGIVGYDLTHDDARLDPLQIRRPADQLCRGICNILFGVCEVPLTIFRIGQTEGDLPGLVKGPLVGLWRFVCREIVGVVETVTFPFGWEPIIEPAYVLNDDNADTYWKVHKPSFHKRY